MSRVELIGADGEVDGAGGGIDDWPWLADLLDREPPPPVCDGAVNAPFFAAVAELLGEHCGEADRAPGAVDAAVVGEAAAALSVGLPALGGLSDHALVTEIAAGERRLAVVAAQLVQAMVELAGRAVFTLADNRVLPEKVRAGSTPRRSARTGPRWRSRRRCWSPRRPPRSASARRCGWSRTTRAPWPRWAPAG